MRCGHLLTRPLILRTLAPVFIGSGKSLNKKEYIFDGRQGRIHFPDFPRLLDFLKSRALLPQYEQFLLEPRQRDFRAFLSENQVREKDYSAFVSYSIDAGEAVRAANFREVLTFNKECDGYPYIPGSSLKGAIRTALAAWLLKKGNWEREKRDIEAAEVPRQARYYLDKESGRLERKIFYRLGIQNPRDGRTIFDPINDFMRAVRISDSASLSFDDLTLTGKYDRKPDGSVNPLPIFRECLIPGTEVRFQMTLEIPMLDKAGLALESLETALHEFADAHYANFEQHFPELPNDAEVSARRGVDIILGGGAGYASKTLTYNLYPRREQALKLISGIMARQFPPRHGHSRDADDYQVSPHTLKTALYKEEYYQMGRCELILK
jgi:CRISPR-associated protein Csm5